MTTLHMIEAPADLQSFNERLSAIDAALPTMIDMDAYRSAPYNHIPLQGNQTSVQREMLYSIVGERAVCAEVGVFTGRNSVHMLASLRPRELHLADPWAIEHNSGHGLYPGTEKAIPFSSDEIESVYQTVKATFRNNKTVSVIRAVSTEAAARFPDGYFDFIYIDGNHDYDFVQQDITAWFPKLKPDGIMAGDDLPTYDVARAVMEFCESRGFKLFGFFSPGSRDGQFLIDHAHTFDLGPTIDIEIKNPNDHAEFVEKWITKLPGRPTSELNDAVKNLASAAANWRAAAAHLMSQVEALESLHKQQQDTYSELLRQHLMATGVLTEDAGNP